MSSRAALDSAGATWLVVTSAGLEVQGDGRSRDVTSRALQRLREHLVLVDASGRAHRADARGRFTVHGELRLLEARLATWSGAGVEVATRLCPFELRTLAETGFPHPRTASWGDAPLHTDLHVHFAGAPRAATLLEVGLAHDLRLPAAVLEEAGVRGLEGEVPLRALRDDLLARVADALALPVDRQSTFRDMERAYRLRGPFTRSLKLFPALLDAVAADYAAMGVRRVELSQGDLYRREWLEAAVAGARRAEAAHGLSLRFLLALSRHNDPEWDEDLFERLDALAPCRELCGVDWMGHETNSTRAFADRLARLARWADERRPGFVLRVHAGENPAFPENVRVAAEAVRGCDVSLRVGHALFGAEEALEALRETGAIVELNLTSNYTLNNLASTADAPLERLLQAGVRCVLGTDGPGLYGTTTRDELRVARLAGLTDAQYAALRATEVAYLARQLATELRFPATFEVPEAAPFRHFTPEVAVRKAEARRSHREQLLARLGELGVVVHEGVALPQLLEAALAPPPGAVPADGLTGDAVLQQQPGLPGAGAIEAAEVARLPMLAMPGEIAPATGGVVGALAEGGEARTRRRRVVNIAGAWRGAWAAASEASRSRIVRVLDELLAGLPKDTLLVTGGTKEGVEGQVHRLARQHGLRTLGAIVEATAVADLDAVSEAVLLAATPHEKAPALYEAMRDADALCLFFGGGNVVHDELRAAANLRLRLLALSGVDGASGAFAERVPHRAFHEASDALRRLDDRRFFHEAFAPFWHPGVNPTVDVVVRRGDEVLLIRRHADAPAEPNQWALPGGFVHTSEPRGEPFAFDEETPLTTALREVREEAGLELSALRGAFVEVAQVEGGGRDERDTALAWSRTWLFTVTLDAAHAALPVRGGDDAQDARWFPLTALPSRLAFDHARLLRLALAVPPRR